MSPWTQPWFKDLLHAEVSGLVILEADGTWAPLDGDFPEVTAWSDAPKNAANPEERPPSQSIPEVSLVFDPVRVPREALGGVGPYKAYPVLVGDIMPWWDFIPGTGKWYHLLDYLYRKMAATYPVLIALREVRRAWEQVFWDHGARELRNNHGSFVDAVSVAPLASDSENDEE